MHVLAHPDRRPLADALAERLEAAVTLYQHKVFPDGEQHVRVPESLSGQALVLADLHGQGSVVETLLALDATAQAGAERIVLAVPYLAYARQDRAFEPGEAISARAIYQALSTAADALVTVDVHTEDVLGFFEGEAANAFAAPELAQALAQAGVDQVLAPDAGARQRAAAVADLLEVESDHLEKTRHSGTEVTIEPKALDVAGHTVAIVDDIIATGGTMATATGQLLEAGAEKVLVAATHGVFAGEAIDRLDKAGVDQIVVTDSIPTDRSSVSCAGALARGLQALR